MTTTQTPSTGGRPATVSLPEIVAVGRDIGMADLSVAAVAQRLGVTPAALYRHVQNRWELERLVGESLLGELRLHDESTDTDLERHLLRLGLQLHRFARARPGLAGYLLTLFPRGDAGLALLQQAGAGLLRRGLSPEVAAIASNAVASLTFALTAAQERQASAIAADRDFATELSAASARIESEPALAAALADLPALDGNDYTRLLLAAGVRGVVASIADGGDGTAILTRLGERLAPLDGDTATTES